MQQLDLFSSADIWNGKEYLNSLFKETLKILEKEHFRALANSCNNVLVRNYYLKRIEELIQQMNELINLQEIPYWKLR
jgi:hypothetical protein